MLCLQFQLQVANQKSQEARAAAAEALSSRAQLRRTLQNFRLAVQNAAIFRQLQTLAGQHRLQVVQQSVLHSWRHCARRSQGIKSLQCNLRRRLLHAGLSAWIRGVALGR